MKRLYVGIVLGVKVCAWCAIDGKGLLISCGEFQTSEQMLIDSVKDLPGEVHVLVEECELSGWAYRALLPHAKTVTVCDPRRNAWVAKGQNKSDRVDAEKLAELLRMKSYSAVYNPEDEIMASLKKAVQQEIKISQALAKLKCVILSQFRREGVSYRGISAFTEKGRGTLLEAVSNDRNRSLILQNYRRVESLKEEKAVIRKMVRSFQADLSILSRLMQVPGVGPVSAARFVAFVQTPHRFSSKRKLWRYSKLGIVNRSSDGKSLGRQRLDWCASGVLKDVSRTVFMAALSCREENLFKRSYRRSLARTENPIHARLNTQRKILSVLMALWRDGADYNDDIDRA